MSSVVNNSDKVVRENIVTYTLSELRLYVVISYLRLYNSLSLTTYLINLYLIKPQFSVAISPVVNYFICRVFLLTDGFRKRVKLDDNKKLTSAFIVTQKQ